MGLGLAPVYSKGEYGPAQETAKAAGKGVWTAEFYCAVGMAAFPTLELICAQGPGIRRDEGVADAGSRNHQARNEGSERSGAGHTVIFSSDAVLVGHSWFRLAAKGLSRFTYVRIAQGAVPSIEFSMTLTVHGAGTLHQTARYRGHLRVPIAENAGGEAARVVSHFQRMVSR